MFSIPKYFDDLKIPAIKNGCFDLFDTPKLIPIIFSHGLTSLPSQYSRHLIELASHGYLVLAISHNDGSSAYTEKEDGSPIWYDTSFK